MHDYSFFLSHTLKKKGRVMMMNDPAQDLEQLIRQYTQELLRFQQQYAAQMPPTADRPDIQPPAEEGQAPPAPMPEPATLPPEEPAPPLTLSDAADTAPRSDEEPSESPLPAMPLFPDDAMDDPWENRDLMSDPDADTPQAFPPAAPPPAPAPDMTDFGQLQVQVFKAREAIPIENATVTIFSGEEDGLTPVTVTTTNRSGFTPAITLPTVAAALSLEPGNAHPYATYIVQVNAPGYFTVEDVEVPVYSGITSVQPAEMLPLPENYQGDTTVTYPEAAPEL